MRHKRQGVELVLPEVGRDSSGKNVSREAISSAGRIWDKAEPTVGPVHQVGSATRERADLNPKVFRNEVARAIGKLWQQDDKSRNSARSAIPWAARVGDSGARTRCPAGLATGCGFDRHDLSTGT